MRKKQISNLFIDNGLILENSNSTKINKINKEKVKKYFEKYGVIVLRGFDFRPKNLTSFTDYFTETYAEDALRRSARFGTTNVKNVDHGFDEVDLHSEASFAPSWPEIIWFYCVTPNINGGATTLCDGTVLWKKLSLEAKKFFLSNPIIYKLKIPVGVKKKNKGIKPWLLNNPGVGNCFLDFNEGFLNLNLSRFAVHEGRNSKYLCFTNHLLSVSAEKQIINATVSENKKIPNKFLDEIKTKSENLTYEFNWKKKDLMMIDNRRFIHGRRAYRKNDPRDIVNIQSYRASFGYGFSTRSKARK